MRQLAVLAALILAAAFAFSAPPQSKPASAAEALKPVAWFVGGTWVADVKSPDGQVTHVENRIRWAPNRTAIEFNTDFNGEPHYNGFYAYDPAGKVIRFYYTDSGGQLTNGTAQPDPDGKTIRQEFTITKTDGTSAHLRSTLLHDSEDSYLFTVFGEKGQQEFQVRYQRRGEAK